MREEEARLKQPGAKSRGGVSQTAHAGEEERVDRRAKDSVQQDDRARGRAEVCVDGAAHREAG